MKAFDLKKWAKQVVTLVLMATMIVGILPPIVVTANSDTLLATIAVGEIWEFRNTSDRTQTVRLYGNDGTFGDRYVYPRSINLGGARGTAIGWNWTGSGNSRTVIVGQNISVPRDGMLVIEVRVGSSVTAMGDPSVFQVRQLLTPVLDVRVMNEGVTMEFVNSSVNQHFVSWFWSGYPRQTAGVGNRGITHHRIRVDGTSTSPSNSGVGSGTSVQPGETLVLRGNQMNDWPREVWGSFTAFSGQPYRLTIDGQRSYPPGVDSADFPQTNQTPPQQPQITPSGNITLYDIALYSREAILMFNMMRRTNFENPFERYFYARQIATGRGSNDNARMQYAYYRVLLAMLNGETNTHQEGHAMLRNTLLRESARLIVPSLGALTLGPLGGTFGTLVVETAAGLTVRVELSRELQIALDEMYLLMMLYNNANPNLRVAISHVLHAHYSEYHTHIAIAFANAVGATVADELTSQIIEQVFGGPLGTVITSVHGVISAIGEILDISTTASDRILAMEGIRQAAWGSYGQIANAGRHNYQFTEHDLLTAYNLFIWLHHLTAEQTGNPQADRSWVGLARPIPIGGGFRWDTERLNRERNEIYLIGPFPGRYPLSWNNRGEDPMRIEGAESLDGWALDYVRAGVSAGIVPRNLQNNYNQPITRAEFAALAVALYESRRGEITGRIHFDDTNDINVQKAAYRRIVNGRDGNNFDPNGTITREEAAALLARTADRLGRPMPRRAPTFDDVIILPTHWSFYYIGQVQAAGVMQGVGPTFFSLSGQFTRQQSIIAIVRLHEGWLGR